MKIILISFLILCMLIINNSCAHYIGRVFYKVTGTKNNVIIKYKGRASDKSQDKNLTTITVDSLPWEELFIPIVESTYSKKDPWFVSAYSESEGEMTVIISGYSNTTTNKYIEMSIPFSDWRNMNETNE